MFFEPLECAVTELQVLVTEFFIMLAARLKSQKFLQRQYLKGQCGTTFMSTSG